MRRPTPWKPPVPLPGPVASKRLLVRWWEPRDAEGLYEAVSGDRAALLPWLPWAQTEHLTPEESLEVIERFARDRSQPRATDFVMGIFDRADGAVVGGTGLHRVLPEVGQAEMGYWVRGSRQGQGLCTEAASALLGAAFGPWGLRRIVVSCAGSNRASQRVVEKLGIRLESVEREARWLDGVGWEEYRGYGVLAHEWDAEAGRVKES